MSRPNAKHIYNHDDDDDEDDDNDDGGRGENDDVDNYDERIRLWLNMIATI